MFPFERRNFLYSQVLLLKIINRYLESANDLVERGNRTNGGQVSLVIVRESNPIRFIFHGRIISFKYLILTQKKKKKNILSSLKFIFSKNDEIYNNSFSKIKIKPIYPIKQEEFK